MNELEEFRVSNDALGAPDTLHRRFREEGYVFIKGLLDRDQLLSLRREMMTTIQDDGWLVAGTDPADGIANPSARDVLQGLGVAESFADS